MNHEITRKDTKKIKRKGYTSLRVFSCDFVVKLRTLLRPRAARFNLTSLLLLACALPICARAQDGGAAQGAITGQVIDDGGQPIANARVFASNQRRSAGAASNIEGRFSFPDLARGTYSVTASAPGYFDPTVQALDPAERRYYRPGDAVTIRLSKGGVITGRVTDAGGEPLAVTRVFAIRLRAPDEQGAGSSPVFARANERATDDRGVYRFYGLPPGVYLVGTGGRGLSGLSFPPSVHDEDVPTFYPSTTRDGATEVVVRAGQEVGDIDIRHRGEAGHAVGGVIENASMGEGASNAISLTVVPAGLNYVIAARFLSRFDNNLSFVFPGLADGDYDVMAEQFGGSPGRNTAASQRVSVRGADVTGVRLALAPLASITGRVVLEAAPAAAPWAAQCQTKLDAVMGEIMLNARREPDARPAAAQPAGARAASAAPDDKGEFALRNLAAGRVRLNLRPPGPDWYVRAATLAPAKPDNARPPASLSTTSANTPAHATSTSPLTDGLTLAAGTQVSGLTLTLAPGAASFRGRVAGATDGAPLPELFVYLVPVERERADDPLRYATARVRSDGSFAFTNLAPGRYHIVARPAPARTPPASSFSPSFPDADTRAQLRHAVETTDAFELQPCQRRDDYVLRYAPQ